MRVGIIGSGQIARIHGPLILAQPGAALVGVADPDLSRAKSLADALGVGRAYSDPEEMIQDLRPDVVHILAPPVHHARLSKMAMHRGCHVLVEKPMALTAADAQDMLQTAAQTGRRLCVDHNLLFDD